MRCRSRFTKLRLGCARKERGETLETPRPVVETRPTAIWVGLNGIILRRPRTTPISVPSRHDLRSSVVEARDRSICRRTTPATKGALAPNSQRSESGFTLLEVLVAFTILTLVLSAVYQRLGLGVQMMGLAEGDSAAASTADIIMTELGRTRPLSYGLTAGEIGAGMHWRLLIQPTRDRAPNTVLPRLEGHDVALVLSWLEHGHPRQAEFHTLQLGVER